MATDSWKHNGQRTLLHAHAYSCTGCQGEVGGGVPFSTALSLLSYHGNRQWLETTGERNHGVCFTTSYELSLLSLPLYGRF